MTVLNRSMFRRPSALPPLRGPMPVVRETYPVVKRDEGTPQEGEKRATTFFEKLFDAGTNLGPGTGPYADTEQGNVLDLREYGAGVYDITDPQFIEFIKGRYMYEGDTFQDGIANYIEVLKGDLPQQDPNGVDEGFTYSFDVDGNPTTFSVGEKMAPQEGEGRPYVAPPKDDVEIGNPHIFQWEARNRQTGSPPMGEQVNANNVGIMDGFEGEQVAQEVMGKGSAAKDEIDKTDTYDELMQAVRGDDLSEHDRRQELASVVGEKDAYETPDSVLALVQPVMQMLNTETADTGIGQIEEGQQMANVAMPQQPVGIAHGGSLRKIPGYAESDADGVTQDDTIDLSTINWGTIADALGIGQPNLKATYEEKLPLYTEILKGSATSPDVLAGETWGDISQAAYAWGQGASPGEAMNFLTQSLTKRAALNDKEKRTMDVQLRLAALKAAEGDVQLEKTLLNKIETKRLEQDAKDKKGTTYVKSLIEGTEEAPMYAEIPEKFGEIVGLNELIATLAEGTTVFVDKNDKLTITPPTLDAQGTSYMKTADSVIPKAFEEIVGLVDVIGTLPIGTNIFVDKNNQVKITEPTKDEKGTSYVKTADSVIPTAFEEITGLNELIETLPEGSRVFVDSKNKITIDEPTKDDKGTSYMKTADSVIPEAFGEIAGLNELIATLPEGTNIHVDSKNKTFINIPPEADSEAYYDMVNKKVIWLTDGELNNLTTEDRDNLTTVGEGTSWVKMRITKDPLEAGGDPVIEEVDVRLFDVEDYKANGYIVIPNSQITVGAKEGLVFAEGGPVVKRSSGTDESGEGGYTEEEILEEFKSPQPVLASDAAKDQAKKLVAAGDLALKNLVKLKNLILHDPTLAGVQGQIIESGRDVFQILNNIENSVLGDIIWKDEKEGGWVEWFDKPEIESIRRLKSDIAAALGDLRYFKGARQPNWMVNLQATREADVTGLFGHEKALGKIDSMAVKLADLLKYYTSLSGNTLVTRQNQIDTLVERIHNMQSPEDTTQTSIGGMTIDQIKEKLPPEMLEAIDSDPNVMDAISVIMKGADIDLVIERFNELKQAE